MKLLLFVCTFLAAGGAVATDLSPLDLAPPDSALLVGVNLAGMKSTTFGQTMWLAPEMQARGAMLGQMLGAPAGELLDSIREVLFVYPGSTGAPVRPAGKQKTVVQANRGLALVSGSFANSNVEALFKKVSDSVATMHGVRVYSSKQGVSIAVVDGSLLAAGDAATVRWVLAHRGKGGGLDPALAAKARALSARYHIWIASGPKLAELTKSAPAPKTRPRAAQGEMLDAIRQFSGGIEFAPDRLVADFQLDARTDLDAIRLRDNVKMLLMMGAWGENAREIAPLLQRVSVTAQAGTVRLGLAIPEQDVMRMVMAARAAAAQGSAPQNAEPVIHGPSPAGQTGASDPPPAGDTNVVILPGPQRK